MFMFKMVVDHFAAPLAATGMRLMLRTADVTLAENVGPKWMHFPFH